MTNTKDMGIWLHSVKSGKLIGSRQETYLSYDAKQYSSEEVIQILNRVINKLK
jgi:hypothetical protein